MEDASQKLLDSILTNLTLGNRRSAVLLWDLNPLTGGFMETFILNRQMYTVPLYYQALVEDAVHKDWLLKTKTVVAAEAHYEDKLPVPGFSRIPPEVPADLFESSPTAGPLVFIAGASCVCVEFFSCVLSLCMGLHVRACCAIHHMCVSKLRSVHVRCQL